MIKKPRYIIPLLLIVSLVTVYLVRGKEEKKIPVVGFVSLTDVDQQTFEGFRKAMESYGYLPGESIRYLHEGPAGEIEKLDAMVQRQLQHGVDLFFVSSTPGVLAVKKAIKQADIPVVFCPVNDPVSTGVVESLTYPGGNYTGIRLPSNERKRFEWLPKFCPNVTKVLLPYTPGDKSSEISRIEAFYAAQSAEINLIEAPVENGKHLQQVLQQYAGKIDALFIPRDSGIESHILQLVAYAENNRLPLAAPSLQQVEAGGLFTYGFVHADMGRQAAAQAHKILQGETPAKIPVETAENHLIINLKAAEKIGLDIPPYLLAEAERLLGATEKP